MGMYTLLSILFVFLMVRELNHGPDEGPGVDKSHSVLRPSIPVEVK